jgi:hypothetical protein
LTWNLRIPNNYFATRKVKYGPWYNPTPLTGVPLRPGEVVTEFGCQGLNWISHRLLGSDMKWTFQVGDYDHPRINAVNPRVLRLTATGSC